ncbi:hypothetical protein [Delftia acidovorans]|uniref:hypothetical protein n=1 Tax=Delftia acidovorans TaxID=80866 RepID=UPI002FDE6F9A
MQIVYIEDRLRGESLAEAMRAQPDLRESVVIACMAPPLPVLIEQHHAELVQVLAQLERQPRDEALLEQQRELSSTIDALQRAADRVSGVALDQPADGQTIAMRRAFDIRFGQDSRQASASMPVERLAVWAAAWRAAVLETMASMTGAMVCNIELEPAELAEVKAQLTTADRRGIRLEPIPHQARAIEIKVRWLLSEIVDRLQLVKACAYRPDSGAIAAELEWLAALHGAAQSWGMFDQQPATPAVGAPAAPAGVPGGWRLVPVEPTREMLDAYVRIDGRFHSARADWAAMLAAAPQAPAAPAGDASDPALPSWWPDFIQCVAELPDRNSPEDEPDAMIATAEELGACAIAAQAEAKGA